MKTRTRRRLPLPPRPHPMGLFFALAAGVVGTALLYDAATGGALIDLVFGGPLFGAGLYFAGWPFVLASTQLKLARQAKGR